MLHDPKKENFTLSSKCINHIILELLNRQISLKIITTRLVESMPVKNVEKINNILRCVDAHVKPGEYWNTVKILVLQPSFQPFKHTLEMILKECINYENFTDIEDVNDILFNKLHPSLMSALDKHLVERFKNLTKQTVKDSCSSTLIQDFGKNSAAENIASPDSNADEILLQEEVPKICDVIVTNNDANTSYTIQPIGNNSIYIFIINFYEIHSYYYYICLFLF